MASTRDANNDFTLSWTNLTYTFHNGSFKRAMASTLGTPIPEYRSIFRGISGHVTSGEMIGILGPSGAGKTILLECLIGKRFNGLSGRINVSNHQSRGSMEVAYIPQDDKMFGSLTCREACIFSSKCQNSSKRSQQPVIPSNDTFSMSYRERIRQYRNQGSSSDEHTIIANRVLEQTGLTVVADTRIGSCSGGQQKRISLAMSLVTQPSVLVVDEPTSGLDSTAAEKIIELLSTVARGTISQKSDGSGKQSNCIVFVTIHQPNWTILNIFDKIYMFTRTGGKILYEGLPSQVPSTLIKFGARYSKFSNPADVLMEVACGCYPDDIVQKMIQHQEDEHLNFIDEHKSTSPRGDILNQPSLSMLTKKPNFNFIYLFWLVLTRAIVLNLRDPWMLLLRIGAAVLTPLMFYIVFDDAGSASGCPPRHILGPDDDMYDPPYDYFKRYSVEADYEALRSEDGTSLLFMLSLIGMFLGIMPVLMTIPGDLPPVCKEVYNNWYNVPAYYIGRFFSELPFTILSQTMYIVPIYFITKMPDEDIWRLFVVLGVNYVFAIGTIAHGLFVTSFFLDHIAAGIYVGTCSLIPILVASGNFIPYRDMSMTAFYTTYLSYHRFVVETSILGMFGWDRCGGNEVQTLTLARDTFFNYAFKLKSQMISVWSIVLGVNASDLPPTIDTNFGNVYALTEVFSQTYLKKYFNRMGKATTIALVETDLDEDDIGPDLLLLFTVSIIFLVVPYALLSKRVHRRE